MPKEYSFKDIGGYNFLQPVRDQSACGSCFTTSFVAVIESRLNLMYGHAMPQVSMQFILSCNYLNEGCEGGWSILNGYWAENAYLVDEDCAPYKSKTKGIACSKYQSCPPIAKVKSSYFLGGAFGQF